MRRRHVVQALLVLLGAALLGALAMRDQLARVARRAYVALKPRIDRTAPTGPLDPPTRRTIVALGEALVSDAPLPVEDLDLLGEHVDDRATRRPGYLALYRSAAVTLDTLGPGPFASLGLDTRIELVTRHRLEQPALGALLLPFGRRLLAIRSLVGPDLVSGYYLSPSGWATIGYRTFPGRCGELGRYTAGES